MAHLIESAKSSRAMCRTCRQKIEKDALRFGEEVPNAFSTDGGTTHQWHHLLCAAKSRPAKVKETLPSFAGEIPHRDELERALASAKDTQKPEFPYAERAPTGRSKCAVCEAPIEKGALRIAYERELDTGMFVARSAGYLHAGCAPEHFKDEADLLGKLKANSKGLEPGDGEALAFELESAGAAGAQG